MHITGKQMKIKGKMVKILTVLLITLLCFSQTVFGLTMGTQVEPVEPETESETVRIPISIAVPNAIAGIEFEMEYSAGLKFLSYEKSEAVSTAYTTPVVEKDGKTYFGFFYGSNDYEPKNGVLDLGHIVFEYSGQPNQYVMLTEAKYVEVIDKDNTNSTILPLNEIIHVPLSKGSGINIGEKPRQISPWIIAACAVVLAAAAAGGIVIYKRKKNANAAADDELSEVQSDEENQMETDDEYDEEIYESYDEEEYNEIEYEAEYESQDDELDDESAASTDTDE